MTHSGYPGFMNNSAAGFQAKFVFSIRFGRESSPAHVINDFPKGLLHVPRLEAFVVTPLKAKPQHWNSPAVNSVRVDFAVAISVRDHFPASREANHRTVVAAEG